MAAFIYRKNQLLAIGQNDMLSTNAKAFRFGEKFRIKKFIEYPMIHAEIDAISKLWGRHHMCDKDTMVVVRLDKNGNPRLAKPCTDCMNVINAIGFKKVYWTS
jgi:deoxycytidylate deaminase